MTENLYGKVWVPSEVDMSLELEFIRSQVKELGEGEIIRMIDIANRYRHNAYKPYSGYPVGACLRTNDGHNYGGCNHESVAYSPTDHAEALTIARASSEGHWKKDRKFIKAMAVVHDGDSGPCGECLQRIVEHADNCLIIVANPDGNIRRLTSLKAIFPYNFNPSHLGK